MKVSKLTKQKNYSRHQVTKNLFLSDEVGILKEKVNFLNAKKFQYHCSYQGFYGRHKFMIHFFKRRISAAMLFI